MDIHSRSRLAGYQPEVLFNAIVLIVGVGALGQNLAQNLALAGVGEITIVDFDTFESHNATRSPLYPRPSEQVLWGLEKARVVAHKLLAMMTAPDPKVRFAVAPMQSLGDLPIAHAHVVFSAVDNPAARAYLAERCHARQRPLIEGGFHAEAFNLSVFGSMMEEPCYRCLYPEKVGAYSCTRYALQLEKEQAIPALQNTATVLAGLQAEVGIQWLHGNETLRNQRVYGNIRQMTMDTVELPISPACPGIHHAYSPLAMTDPLNIHSDDTLAQLLNQVFTIVGPSQVVFPEPIVMRNFCTRCHQIASVNVPEWNWLMSPFCNDCGGPFPRAAADQYISSRTGIHTTEQEDELAQLLCRDIGLTVGTAFEIWPDAHPTPNTSYLLTISGSIDEIIPALSRE